MSGWSGWVRTTGVLLTLTAFGVLATGNGRASAAPVFPTTPMLDNFATDTGLSAHLTTPALGEGMVRLDSANHELTGVDSNNWDAAIWNPPFTSPVEAWATIKRAGINDAALYANVIGGDSGTVHDSSGYFVDFGGTASGGSPSAVSLWRIDGPETEVELTSAPSPSAELHAGDEIGLSDSATGVLVAWYKPSGGSWSAVVSAQDSTYTSGNIALEAIPGTDYGFSNFGGGSPAMPVQSAITTTTSIAASAAGVTAGQPVSYTATVSPAPDGGTVSFADNGVAIPDCGARPVNGSGTATCTVTYTTAGKHVVTAVYTGSSDGKFAGSTNGPDAIVVVTAPTAPPGPTVPTSPIAPPRPTLVATNTSLSLSNATPAAGTAARYAASVSPAPRRGYGLIHRRWCGYPRLHRPAGDERILDLQLHVSGFRDRPAPRRVQRRRPLRGF